MVVTKNRKTVVFNRKKDTDLESEWGGGDAGNPEDQKQTIALIKRYTKLNNVN